VMNDWNPPHPFTRVDDEDIEWFTDLMPYPDKALKPSVIGFADHLFYNSEVGRRLSVDDIMDIVTELNWYLTQDMMEEGQ